MVLSSGEVERAFAGGTPILVGKNGDVRRCQLRGASFIIKKPNASLDAAREELAMSALQARLGPACAKHFPRCYPLRGPPKYVVQEDLRAPGTVLLSFSKFISKFPHLVRRAFELRAEAMACMHLGRVVHRDLSLSNLLVRYPAGGRPTAASIEVFIVDFGWVHVYRKDTKNIEQMLIHNGMSRTEKVGLMHHDMFSVGNPNVMKYIARNSRSLYQVQMARHRTLAPDFLYKQYHAALKALRVHVAAANTHLHPELMKRVNRNVEF